MPDGELARMGESIGLASVGGIPEVGLVMAVDHSRASHDVPTIAGEEQPSVLWLLRQLEDRNRRLAAVNEHLRAYGRDVARLTREEELLAAKVHVHDEVGRALVALRVYERQDPSERDREGLLLLWRGIEGILQSAQREENPTDDWELLRQAETESAPVCAEREGSFHAALAALHGNVSADLLNAMLKCCISRIEYRRERGTRTGRGWEMRPIRLRIELRL